MLSTIIASTMWMAMAAPLLGNEHHALMHIYDDLGLFLNAIKSPTDVGRLSKVAEATGALDLIVTKIALDGCFVAMMAMSLNCVLCPVVVARC
jgi:hypothetical protein